MIAQTNSGAGMARIHLIADDLTGALDGAVDFVGLSGIIPVRWQGGFPLCGASAAIDSGTRELGRDAARATVAALAASAPPDGDAIRYAKLDSLLRGHAGAEIAAWLDVASFDHCIIAPAFPVHRRVTRAGRQLVQAAQGAAQGWRPTGAPLVEDLAREGVAVRLCGPGDPAPSGVSLWDAETDADLDAVARAGQGLAGRVLWCGSGGLAGALARVLAGGRAAAFADQPPHPPPLPRPVLGLFGTDHPVTRAQLAACQSQVMSLPDGGPTAAAALSARLAAAGAALVRLDLPDGLTRAEAARRIDRDLGALVNRLDPPGTLLVSGGETLRGLCRALDADRLDLDGRMCPGVPRSILRGGRFDGVRVVSKSGAFGDPLFLRRLLTSDAAFSQGDHA